MNKIISYGSVLFLMLLVAFLFLGAWQKSGINSYKVGHAPAAEQESAAELEVEAEHMKEAESAPEKSAPLVIEGKPRLTTSASGQESHGVPREGSEPEESGEHAATIHNRLDEYTVKLGANEKITLPGSPGELRVWIGSGEYEANFPETMVSDTTTLPALGESAKVAPFAPDFEVKPGETQCVRIHPTGSEVRFQLIPRESGTFNVGANVFLYGSLHCQGAPIPKTTATLQVRVEVNSNAIIMGKIKELLVILWTKVLDFWGALVALVLGLVLIAIRGKLQILFGYKKG